MSNNRIRTLSVILTICLLMSVLPISAMADGCKWRGETMRYTIGAAANEKTYIINCDSYYSVDIQYDENPLYRTSSGYVNNWVKVKNSYNKNQIKLGFEKNYSSYRRTCRVVLTCNTHQEKKTLVITQNAGTDRTPTISLSTNRLTVSPGGQAKFTVTTQYSCRLFVDLMTSRIQTYNINYTTSTSKTSKTISFNVPREMPVGVYRLYIETSNSPKSNDAWARRAKKYIDVLVQAPVSAPVIKNANTGDVFNPSQTMNYNLTNGNLSLSWSAENGCGYYKVVIIGLNESPKFSDSSQLSRAAYKLMNTDKTSMHSITITSTTMQRAPYIKIAIGAYQNKTDTAPVKWTNVGLRICNYNPISAIQYARKWTINAGCTDSVCYCNHNSYNPAYKAYIRSAGYFENADCANYVSQCLFTGGIPIADNWKPGKYDWINVDGLKSYLHSLGYMGYSGGQIDRRKINIGDLIYTSSTHVMIVTKIENNRIYACGHTHNRKDYAITSIVYHIKMS